MDIKAAVTHSQGESFKLESVQLAEPEFDEIRVRILGGRRCGRGWCCRLRTVVIAGIA